MIVAVVKMSWILVVVLSLCVMACSDGMDVIDEFPRDERLMEEPAEGLENLYKAISVTNIQGKTIFSVRGDFLLKVYDADFGKSHQLLRRGHGNNEWIAPMLTGQMVEIDGKSYACVLERAGGTLYAVDLDETTSQRKQLAEFRDRGLAEIRSAYVLGDGSLVGMTDSGVCEWFSCKKGSREVSIIDMPTDKSLFSSNPSLLSQGVSTYSDKEHKIAFAYYAYPMLVFADETFGDIRKVQIGKSMPSYDMATAQEPHDYIVDICSTDQYVYVLYDAPKSSKEMSILVFDWAGNPMARYHTARLRAFAVDEAHSRFIAVKENDEDGCCCVYRFKSYL